MNNMYLVPWRRAPPPDVAACHQAVPGRHWLISSIVTIICFTASIAINVHNKIERRCFLWFYEEIRQTKEKGESTLDAVALPHARHSCACWGEPAAPVVAHPAIEYYSQGKFGSKQNCIYISMLLHLPVWMMKKLLFLTIWIEDFMKAALIYLLNVHQ
jgi:hypothetical protein